MAWRLRSFTSLALLTAAEIASAQAELQPAPESPQVQPAPAQPEMAADPEPEAATTDPMDERPVDAAGISFKPGKGLSVTSADGDFSIVTRLRGQLLYSLQAIPGAADAQSFQVRRARLLFSGNAFGEHNKYKVEFSLAPRDMQREPVAVGDPAVKSREEFAQQVPVLDWYLTFDYLRDLTLVIGQYKVRYSRQRVTSSGNLQFVDRSLATAEFNLDRDIGLDLRSMDLFGLGLLRYYAGVYIGEGRNTSDISPSAGDFGLMYLGRIEVLPLGDFADYSEGDVERVARPGLSIGVAYAYLEEAPRTRGILGSPLADELDFHNLTADVVFKWRGLAAFTEFFLRRGVADADASRSDGWGFAAQASYVLPVLPLEFGARYGMVRSDAEDDAPALVAEQNELGGELSYYFAEHAFKLQADLFQIWNPAGSFSDGLTQFRMQLQTSL